MNHSALKKFAQNTRKKLITQISIRLDYVLEHDDPYLRAHATEKQKIEKLLLKKGREQLLEETAYIWFNRLTALSFMDNRGYNTVKIVSPAEGETQPQLLAEIKQGRVPGEITGKAAEANDYISGRISVPNPDREAYKTALLAWCNYMGKPMPYLFARIDDWAALLLPQDLLSEESIITDIQKGILPEDCIDVEIIGWLYQYYISEKKDEVFADLKKNKKITPENIPAATQLFTPHWIVRYMVENSLGRHWLNNFPDSPLRQSMKYFVEADKEKEFLKIRDPEEIKVMDPCCGSGHILVYAFDLLYKMYEEEGYNPKEIPELILQNNLFGMDIDDRAAALASFALAMKALEKDRFFFDKGTFPQVIASRNVDVDAKALGIRLSPDLMDSFHYLKDAKNLGSLVPVTSGSIGEIDELKKEFSGRSSDHLFEKEALDDFSVALTQLEYLCPKYHCVITNPPYMGSKGMNQKLKDFVGKYYPDSKSDLFAVFMEKGLGLSCGNGYLGMINQQSWMFLSSYEKLREKLITQKTIISMAHLGARAFNTIGGEVVQTTSFVIKNLHEEINGVFQRLIDGKSEEEKEALFRDESLKFTAKASDFSKIPGSPIAYWASKCILRSFSENNTLEEIGLVRQGVSTSNNERFLRNWHEISYKRIGFNFDSLAKANMYDFKWYPYNKGGSFKKWFGNHDYVINYGNDGYELKEFQSKLNQGWTARLKSREYYFKSSISWSKVTTGIFSARYYPNGFIFDVAGCCYFPNKVEEKTVIAFLNSNVCRKLLEFLSPTLNYEIEQIKKLPFIQNLVIPDEVLEKIYTITQNDWNSYETSWNYKSHPLLQFEDKASRLQDVYSHLCNHWEKTILELHRLEEEINRIIIDLYGLQVDLTPDVPYNEITILQSELEPNALKKNKLIFKKNDIVRQFVSYAVGCIFGRYSLDKDGLILANAGEGFEDYLKQIPETTFKPDESGILPITDEDDFSDDLPNKFKTFLEAAFGTEKNQENLRFVEEAIGKDIRSFFLKDFYKDHLQRYKKRPIYWMISSPSGALRALIYLHRYTKDTIGVFLNDYLRPYQRKLEGKEKGLEHIIVSATASGGEKAQAQKKIDKLRKDRKELEQWERDVVYPLATQRIELDLDDGVKVNYGKLGSILEKVKGLNG